MEEMQLSRKGAGHAFFDCRVGKEPRHLTPHHSVIVGRMESTPSMLSLLDLLLFPESTAPPNRSRCSKTDRHRSGIWNDVIYQSSGVTLRSGRCGGIRQGNYLKVHVPSDGGGGVPPCWYPIPLYIKAGLSPMI